MPVLVISFSQLAKTSQEVITAQYTDESEEQCKQMTVIEFHKHMENKAKYRDEGSMSNVNAMY